MRRLQLSLNLLVQVNRYRLRWARNREQADLRSLLIVEAALDQCDADGRQKVDARQLSLFVPRREAA